MTSRQQLNLTSNVTRAVAVTQMKYFAMRQGGLGIMKATIQRTNIAYSMISGILVLVTSKENQTVIPYTRKGDGDLGGPLSLAVGELKNLVLLDLQNTQRFVNKDISCITLEGEHERC